MKAGVDMNKAKLPPPQPRTFSPIQRFVPHGLVIATLGILAVYSENMPVLCIPHIGMIY